MISDNDIGEAHYAQGDMMMAVQFIAQHNLPLDTGGAVECERLIREYNEGNRRLWAHPDYLRTAIHLAQGAVRESRAHLLREIEGLKFQLRETTDYLRNLSEALDTFDFPAFVKWAVARMNDGAITPEQIAKVTKRFYIPSLFALNESEHTHKLAAVAVALGFKATLAPPPPPTDVHMLECALCGKGFPAKPQQIRHSKLGHRVYCGGSCREKLTKGFELIGEARRYTYRQMIAAGWNDQMLIANGLLKTPRANPTVRS